MLTEEAKKIGKNFLIHLFSSDISASTICEILIMMSDYIVEQEQTCRELLKATKECRTDENFLTAVKGVLGAE